MSQFSFVKHRKSLSLGGAPHHKLAFIIGCRKDTSIILFYYSFFQHEPLDQMTNNHHSSSHSTKRMTSSDGIIKDEPDFVETHCRWLGCDRELHTQEQLVKVRSSRIVLHLLLPITYSILLMPFLGFYSTPISPLPAA